MREENFLVLIKSNSPGQEINHLEQKQESYCTKFSTLSTCNHNKLGRLFTFTSLKHLF